jgi:hypothetical protein
MQDQECIGSETNIPHHGYRKDSSKCEYQEDQTWKEVKRSIVDAIGCSAHRRVAKCFDNPCTDEYEGVFVRFNQSG